MFNPLQTHLRHRAREAADEVFSEGGWHAHYSFAVNRSDGEPLVFEIRTPDGIEMVDAVALVQSARGAPAWVGDALDGLEQAMEVPGVVVVGALCATSTHEVLATLTVMFRKFEGPLNIDEFMPKDSPATIKSDQDYVRINDHMTRIHRISGESQGEGKEPLPVLLIEYLWETKYGLVTLAFATTRLDFMSEEARAIFDTMRQTAYIGAESSVAS
jgi:hypothetical protein